MTYNQFIQPEIVDIGGREFAMSKVPAFQAKAVYADLVNCIRDNGDVGRTMISDESVKALFRHCAVRRDDGEMQVLDSVATIEKYLVETKDFITLLVKMQDYNFGFLTDGTLRELLGLPAEGATESV